MPRLRCGALKVLRLLNGPRRAIEPLASELNPPARRHRETRSHAAAEYPSVGTVRQWEAMPSPSEIREMGLRL